eukprot:CAMPEP_0170170484 /NCGR_PEP_ID=MMETSP0040_2-20121228/3486_1 /TAXON_ID=641309 /ORGANISM="Lotharella oceanica, Strain CCMP622" /LENGTH=213 /DNA_ID=CAMNT_0010409925 /DNA_START=121 /DNA_END=762 /DNA_ORIENTATION=+
MCLIPISGFSDMPTLIPTPRARKLGTAMMVVLCFHVVLAVLEFSALSIIDGMFDMIGALIGYCAIRDPNRYNVYQVLCYCIYTGMDFFWGTVRIILLATKATKVPGNTKWQYRMYVITVIAGTVFYLVACLVSNLLYRELRRILQDVAEPHAWNPAVAGQGEGQAIGYGGGDIHVSNRRDGYQQIEQQNQTTEDFQGTAFKIGEGEKQPQQTI